MTMLGRRNSFTLVGCLLTACMFACTASSNGAGWLNYDHDGLSFRYPASWHAQHFDVVSSFFSSSVYLRNQPMHAPCTKTMIGNGVSISCRQPIDALLPGGVLAWWGSGGMPTWRFGDQPGSRIRLSGRDAKITIERPGTCRNLGADETISVVARNLELFDNYYSFEACLRGPGLKALEGQARAMIDSVTLPP
jgi:hypothetical protein